MGQGATHLMQDERRGLLIRRCVEVAVPIGSVCHVYRRRKHFLCRYREGGCMLKKVCLERGVLRDHIHEKMGVYYKWGVLWDPNVNGYTNPHQDCY